jgi:hypothetical protein
LASLEARVGLVDHIDATLAANHNAIFVTVFQGLQRTCNAHNIPLANSQFLIQENSRGTNAVCQRSDHVNIFGITSCSTGQIHHPQVGYEFEVSSSKMVGALVVAFFVGTSAGLFVAGIGCIASFAIPSSSVWSIMAIVAGAASVVGFGVAERSKSGDPELKLRRKGGVLLLGGFAMLMVLLALYLLPVFRTTLVAQEPDMVGPILGLVFFPMLLIAMGLWLTTNGENGLVWGVTMIGMIAGWALVGPSLAILAPSWGIAGAALGLNLAGLLALSSATR